MYCLLCLQQVKYCASTEPLLNVTDELGGILSGVCRLVGIHELATIVQNGSDLHAVLGQNVLDSCNWVSQSTAAGNAKIAPTQLHHNGRQLAWRSA